MMEDDLDGVWGIRSQERVECDYSHTTQQQGTHQRSLSSRSTSHLS